jgi:hypothetical protein
MDDAWHTKGGNRLTSRGRFRRGVEVALLLAMATVGVVKKAV